MRVSDPLADERKKCAQFLLLLLVRGGDNVLFIC